MTDIIVIEKNGSIKQSSCKDAENLYKSCNFRKADGFDLRHSWNNLIVGKKTFNISVYARDEGKANTENKYEGLMHFRTMLTFVRSSSLRHNL